ncbi:hypothetical protein VIGAN_06135000, partial [Vigna angularis var. angularis]
GSEGTEAVRGSDCIFFILIIFVFVKAPSQCSILTWIPRDLVHMEAPDDCCGKRWFRAITFDFRGYDSLSNQRNQKRKPCMTYLMRWSVFWMMP